jgi:diguanylate cyclase
VFTVPATILNENTRNGDLAARYGGDEFAVILPEATVDEALSIAERIRAAVAACGSVVRAFERAISDGTLTAPLDEGPPAPARQLLRAG